LEVFLDDKQLEALYASGKPKKLKLPEQVIEKFFATVQKIEASVTVHDLLADNGLRFKKMSGSDNRYAMRLNQKYRLEMEIAWEDEAQTIGKFYLQTISNHYDG
jgi:plasmid maintenance system killer protein